MTFRRKKTKKSQVLDLLDSYLKLQAAKQATKGARKAAKGTAVYKAAKDKPRIARAIPLVAGAGIAAIVAVRKLRGGDDAAAAPA